jgi:hypothetical protein
MIQVHFAKFELEQHWFKCRNPNLWLATKTRACKGEGQEGISGITSRVPGSVGECEGMNPHIPK